MAAFVLFAFTVTYFCLKPHEFAHSYKKLLLWGAAALLLLAAVNSYWLVAFFHPATTFEAISQADFAAYQTRTDPTVGVWGNVLSLYGFWNTDFSLPKDSLPFWWALSAVIVAAAAAGAYIRFSQAQHPWHYPNMELYPLPMFSSRVCQPYFAPDSAFLYHFLPGFKGLRETDKITGLLAFTYAFLAPMGLKSASQLLADTYAGTTSKAVTKKLVYVLFLAIPFLVDVTPCSTALPPGAPVDYPASWYQANELLSQSTTTQKVLFLPWWGYLRFPFAHNILIANPAKQFFDSNMVSGQKYENIHLTSAPQTELDVEIQEALDGTISADEFVTYLKAHNFTHIMLVQEEDSPKYAFLFTATQMKKALDTGDLVLFSLQ
jgi:hypothetical protein